MSEENDRAEDSFGTASIRLKQEQEFTESDMAKGVPENLAPIIQDPEFEEIMYGVESNSIAVSNLVLFSALIFTLPLVVMYGCYCFLIDYYHLSRDRSALYSGILGAFVVCFIVILFIWRAYIDETRLARLIDEAKRRRKHE